MNSQEIAKKFEKIFRTHGITLDLKLSELESFAKFYLFLMEYNKKYNLTRLKTFEEVAVKHFVDCLYVAQLTEIPDRLMDVGTGAGFPGIPLKIIYPERRIILAEGVQKKVEYLKELREHLGLKNLDIIGRNVDTKMKYPVNGVITRAVEAVSETLKNVSNCVQSEGVVILMKTPGIENEIREAESTFSGQFQKTQDVDYNLGPTKNQRKLLVFRKLQSFSPSS